MKMLSAIFEIFFICFFSAFIMVEPICYFFKLEISFELIGKIALVFFSIFFFINGVLYTIIKK